MASSSRPGLARSVSRARARTSVPRSTTARSSSTARTPAPSGDRRAWYGRGTIEDLWVRRDRGARRGHRDAPCVERGAELGRRLPHPRSPAPRPAPATIDWTSRRPLPGRADPPARRRSAFVPVAGTTFMIATNACGHFSTCRRARSSRPAAARSAIDYDGGDGDDVVLTASAARRRSRRGRRSASPNRARCRPCFTVTDPDGDVTMRAARRRRHRHRRERPGSARRRARRPACGSSARCRRFGAVGDLRYHASCVDAVGHAATSCPSALGRRDDLLSGRGRQRQLLPHQSVANPNPNPGRPTSLPAVVRRGSFETRRRSRRCRARPCCRPRRRLRVGRVLHARDVIARPPARGRPHHDVGASGYGAHGERATPGPGSPGSRKARRATSRRILLLNNPHPTANAARVTYFARGRAGRPRLRPAGAGPRRQSSPAPIPELVDAAFGIARRVQRAGHRRARDVLRHHAALGGRARVGRLDVALDLVVHGGRGDRQLLQHLHPGREPERRPADVTLTYFPSTGAPVTRTSRSRPASA